MTRVVDIARAWIGTPYLHQASRQGVGTDCLGLLRGIWRELYGAEAESVPNYTRDWSEPQRIEQLLPAARRHLVAKDVHAAAPGDVLIFRMRARGVAKHVGIQAQVGDTPTFIHAYDGHGVVESPLSTPWARKIVGRFAFPDNNKMTFQS